MDHFALPDTGSSQKPGSQLCDDENGLDLSIQRGGC